MSPQNCLSISSPHHVCWQGHNTKIVFTFSLHRHRKWPERILPHAIFISPPSCGLPPPPSVKPPFLTALGKAKKGIRLCLGDDSGIWNWGSQADFSRQCPFFYFPFRLPKPAFFPTKLHSNVAAVLWLYFDLLPECTNVLWTGPKNTWGIGSVAFSSCPKPFQPSSSSCHRSLPTKDLAYAVFPQGLTLSWLSRTEEILADEEVSAHITSLVFLSSS